ncbi:response regulator [Mucilaginibacter sp. ZT4R22]|uniref:Response regulator n=1 Tax=Mucilaginibacter pankratovii TaxID=2772110 RepID=A0ABR7WP03_9SPHI|nr:response regulator [Mucilaginibacter pankratovii]MBD1363094.1 response regulator [Mucilaginibacter pankratovii]
MKKVVKRILIIEDDREILEVLKTILEDHHFEVVGLERSDDILQLVEQHHPDLILTDYLLWGMNGGKICSVIKSHKYTSHIKVVLLTGYQDLAMSFGNFGFDAFLSKPFEIKKLLKTISSCLAA